MQTHFTMSSWRYLVLVTALVLQGCATTYDPDTLAAPPQVSCIYLDQPVTYTQAPGMIKVPWTARLEQGPYWSEKVDANGTYFRAPPGGLSLKNDDGQPQPGHAVTRDGGFYIPNNAAAPVTLYFYYSTAEAPTQPDLLNADCSNLHVLKDPQGKGSADRRVPIAERALEWVTRYLNEVRRGLASLASGEALFLGATGKRIQKSALTDLVGGYIRRSGIGKTGACHALRHATATHMMRGGADIRYIQEMLGHRCIESTQIYTHVTITDLQVVYSKTHPSAQGPRS